jgi:hypothetical protein
LVAAFENWPGLSAKAGADMSSIGATTTAAAIEAIFFIQFLLYVEIMVDS